jgi:cytoskeletal protein RodZ
MMNSKEIGNLFKETREKLNLTLKQVYQKSRIHLRVIQDIESGSFERLAPLYLRSFMRKYAEVLGLDPDDILKKLDAAYHELVPRAFSLTAMGKKPLKEKKQLNLTQKQVQAMVVGGLAVVLVILIFVFIGMLRSWNPFVRRVPRPASAAARKPAAEKKELAQAREAKRSGSVTLTLKAKGKVWVQVKSGEKNLYAGVMNKGESETWKAEGELAVWTGKAENLKFTVNNRKLGAIAAGVVKNIRVSGEGVKIGDNPVTSLE